MFSENEINSVTDDTLSTEAPHNQSQGSISSRNTSKSAQQEFTANYNLNITARDRPSTNLSRRTTQRSQSYNNRTQRRLVINPNRMKG